MRPRPWIALACRWGTLAIFIALTGGPNNAGVTDEAHRLIQLAGNTDDEKARLAALQQLARLPNIAPQLRADAELMAFGVEQYNSHPNLTYFNWTRLEPQNRYNFLKYEIAETSPLYPLLCFYRARQLLWNYLEGGGTRQQLDQALQYLRHAVAAFPGNRLIRMYLGEPTPPKKRYATPPNAPEWAIYQREGLERLADIIEWWIDHRQRDDGQYGGDWGDDCEMWRWWVPVLIAFDDPKIIAAQAKLSNGLMAQPHMAKGYTRNLSDVEHTAEDSSDVITPMMHLQPDNPLWNQRALRLAELMETLWTGRNQRGQLQFKSTYFTCERVDETPQRACDTVYHPRAVQPALLYWQRTGDSKLAKLFRDWMDTWVDASLRSERGKPAGIVPSAIHWPDGTVGGLGPEWWDPRNHSEAALYQWPSAASMMISTMLLTYHMTGDEKYLAPIRAMARIRLNYLSNPPKSEPTPGSEAWCAARLGFITPIVAKYTFLTGSKEFEALLEKDAPPYVAFRRTGSRDVLTQALRRSTQALRLNFEGYTSEVRYTDRVLNWPRLFGKNGLYVQALPWVTTPDPGLLYSSATGDPCGDAGYFPMNAVRWLTRPRDLAALVTDASTKGFVAELFHFGTAPRPMAAECYLLAPGTYTLTLTTADGKALTTPQRIQVTGPRTRISFRLPPRKLCVLRLARAEKRKE